MQKSHIPIVQLPFYFTKQTQFYAFLAQNRGFAEKTNPKQTQFKPNLSRRSPDDFCRDEDGFWLILATELVTA